MNILIIAAEASPFAKTGGLADVTSYLPKELNKLGQNPILVMPKYGFIDTEAFGIVPTLKTLIVPMGLGTEFAALWVGKFPNSNVPVYFIEHEQYFNRPGIYGEYNEYGDNDKRFIFLSRAAFEVAKALEFKPDIIHSHDYHTAFAMAFLKTHYANETLFADTAGVFTIHNLAYQGKFNPYRAMDFSGFGMKNFYPGCWFESDGVVNAMKTGIMFSDKITTVSPTYSREILMPYYGEGLHHDLNYRVADLIGVLNGVYYDDWNPENDALINKNYNIDTITNKAINKVKLIERFGGDVNYLPNAPLFGMVSRLVEQKGIDLMRDSLESLIINRGIKLALLGSGETHYVEFFNYLKWKFPNQVFVYIGYDEDISHSIYAASDFFLVPSRFEPCGLTQMYALKYGSLPIARATGGLRDTVFEYNYETGEGNGIVFNDYSLNEFQAAVERATSLYSAKEHLSKAVINAMNANYSSLRSAEKYVDVYNWAIAKKTGL